MAGDIKLKYGASASLTFTAFNSLAYSATFVGGAGCLAVANTSNLYQDVLVSGLITWSSTAPAAGTYRLDVHAYGAVNDTPTYPQDGSGNALGTDLARTFASADDKLNATAFAASITLAATGSKVYTVKPFAIASLFGQVPTHWGIWCTHGVSTANSTPHSSGNTWSYTGVYAQYT